MTRKNYIEFARILKDQRTNWVDAYGKDSIPNATRLAILGLENELVRYFKSDNSNFDENRFREACNL